MKKKTTKKTKRAATVKTVKPDFHIYRKHGRGVIHWDGPFKTEKKMREMFDAMSAHRSIEADEFVLLRSDHVVLAKK